MSGLDVDELADRLADRVVEKLGKAPDDRPPLKTRAVAERLGLSYRTVWNMLENDVLPSYKIEGSRVVDQAAVDAYLAERREQG
jgi:excisionase family DNA binding protein